MWTDETTEKMQHLLALGWTARRIAEHLGPDYTRSAVVAKWGTMGLTPPKNVIITKRHTTIPRIETGHSAITTTLTDLSSCQNPQVTFDDLSHKTCHYPVSGEGRRTLFCGHPTINRVYCTHHQKLTRIAGTATDYATLLKSTTRNSKSEF